MTLRKRSRERRRFNRARRLLRLPVPQWARELYAAEGFWPKIKTIGGRPISNVVN